MPIALKPNPLPKPERWPVTKRPASELYRFRMGQELSIGTVGGAFFVIGLFMLFA